MFCSCKSFLLLFIEKTGEGNPGLKAGKQEKGKIVPELEETRTICSIARHFVKELGRESWVKGL